MKIKRITIETEGAAYESPPSMIESFDVISPNGYSAFPPDVARLSGEVTRIKMVLRLTGEQSVFNQPEQITEENKLITW